VAEIDVTKVNTVEQLQTEAKNQVEGVKTPVMETQVQMKRDIPGAVEEVEPEIIGDMPEVQPLPEVAPEVFAETSRMQFISPNQKQNLTEEEVAVNMQ
jgi:hypothetical protein